VPANSETGEGRRLGTPPRAGTTYKRVVGRHIPGLYLRVHTGRHTRRVYPRVHTGRHTGRHIQGIYTRVHREAWCTYSRVHREAGRLPGAS